MISLVTIIVTPIIFIGLILTVSSNYKKKVRLVETSNIKHISLLEENKMSVSNVKGQYYNGVINNYTSNIMPLNGWESFWEGITKIKRGKEFKVLNEYVVQILKKIGLTMSLILFFLIIFNNMQS